MIGAIIGDIVGSRFEFTQMKSKEFELFTDLCDYTDDSIITVAVANAIMVSRRENKDFKTVLISEMKRYGRMYPCPKGGYGTAFGNWLDSDSSEPYNSWGNGAAMRVSPCGYAAHDLSEALALAKISAEVTHNHPEGIKGAQATAGAVYLARTGKSKAEIKAFIEENYYKLNMTTDEIRPTYHFDPSCQGTVPQAIQAFLDSTSFEDAIRITISLGGDADTLGAITGSIAWAYYVKAQTLDELENTECDEKHIWESARKYLPDELSKVVTEFTEFVSKQ